MFVRSEIEGERYVTTTEVLSEEKRVVDLVRHGIGKHEKIGLDQGWAIRRRPPVAYHPQPAFQRPTSGHHGPLGLVFTIGRSAPRL